MNSRLNLGASCMESTVIFNGTSMGIKSLLPADMSHDDECSYTVAVVLSFVLKFTWARKKKDITCAIYIITPCLRVAVPF